MAERLQSQTRDLIHARQLAEAGTKAKSEFLANMSHEIRTPINGIMGMAQILQTTELDASQREYVDTSRESCEALLGVINDILDFTKIEAGKIELDPTEVSPRTLIDNVIKVVGFKAEAKGLSLVAEIDTACPAWVSSYQT